jgi:hypothetical protein
MVARVKGNFLFMKIVLRKEQTFFNQTDRTLHRKQRITTETTGAGK